MTDNQVTMSYCAHCDQPVQPSLHTTVQCLDNMRNQRDEAREVAIGLFSHLQVAWEVMTNGAEIIVRQNQEVSRTAERFYPWLKETSKR
jgi:hypothetical protein